MGSGKTTVGRALAERLGWSFLDLDDLVEHWAGTTVEDIFRTWGEPRFRDMEEAVAGETLALERVVLAPGGGWAAAPERLASVPRGTLSVWLKVSPSEAVRRAAGGQGRRRPLLDVADPEARARELLEVRIPRYAEAHLHLDTDGASPADVADAILDYMGKASPGD